MRPRRGRGPWIGVAIAVALVLVSVIASARPGGGHSYSGGGGHSSRGGGGYSGGSSGSSGGGSALDVIGLIVLCIEHPLLGLFVLLVCGVMFALHVNQTSGRSDWSTGGSASYVQARPALRAPSPRRTLEELRRYDADFSAILFEDFVYALYAQAHTARGRGTLDTFSAYLGAGALAALARGDVVQVKAVVIGSLHVARVTATQAPDPTFAVMVEIEANYTEVLAGGREHAWYVKEEWALERRASVRSRTPDRARVFACPSCGAPLDGVMAAHCKYCNKDVCTGEFDWIVQGIHVAMRQPRGPMLTAQTEEAGTDEPSVIDPEARGRLAALVRRDPALTWEAFEARVGLVFQDFQRAWSARDLTSMRPLLSDNLFELQTYWVRAYEAQHLRNVTENPYITNIVLARVASDRFFDAITIRLFAKSRDYTVSEDGRLVCGSRTKERSYSEYWTFIRSAQRTGAPRTDRACPNCGAPLAINMAGDCTYCKAKVTSGDFDWVLARIEQDESYAG